MKAGKITLIMFVILNLTVISFLGMSLGDGEKAEMPAWRPGNLWQYNMTMPSEPRYRQTATIKILAWGVFYADNGTEYPTFNAYYITNVNQTDETYGYKYTRMQDTKSIVREDHSIAHLERRTYIDKGGEEYLEYNNITKYTPMFDPYIFPIKLGEVWEQSTMLNTTSVLYKWMEKWNENEERFDWIKTKVSTTSFFANVTTYYSCTGMENVTVTVVSDWEDYVDNKTVNWTTETFSALTILQDNESQDSDGCYIIEYWSEDVGNIIKKDIFKNHDLYSTRSLVYTDYMPNPPLWVDPVGDERGNPYANLFLWGGLGVIVVLLGVGVIRIRKRVVEEEELTKEDIMGLETRGEYIELCEKFGLSTKGSKRQLRKQLLKYLEENKET